MNFHTIVKGSDSIDTYVQKIKEIHDKLLRVLVVIDDEDIFIHTLNGLPHEFNAFNTSIKTRSHPLNLEELYTLMKAEEVYIENNNNQVTHNF